MWGMDYQGNGGTYGNLLTPSDNIVEVYNRIDNLCQGGTRFVGSERTCCLGDPNFTGGTVADDFNEVVSCDNNEQNQG